MYFFARKKVYTDIGKLCEVTKVKLKIVGDQNAVLNKRGAIPWMRFIVRAYISEFHLSMTNGLNVLLLQLYSKLLLYTDDYYTNIDDALDALFIEDALNTHIGTLRSRLNLIDYFDGEAGTVVGSVSDICSITKPGKASLDEIGKGLIRRTEQLIEDVTVLEESHAGDLNEPQELLDSLKGIMASFFRREGSGGGVIGDLTEHLTKGMDEIVDEAILL